MVAGRWLTDALRCAVGRLFPEPIRQNREALGLRLRDLAGMLGVAEATLSRRETGAQILELDARTINRRMRLVFASGSEREALKDAERPKRLGEIIAGQDRAMGSATCAATGQVLAERVAA